MSRRSKPQRSWKERAMSLLLAAVLLLGTVPGLTLPASAHWADEYLDKMVDWGVMRADQTGNPDAPVTRAEFAGVINRAYGYTETGPIPFEDVDVTDWFYDDIRIAYTAGYMAGTSETTASPNDTLTREMAVCILGRNMMMKETPGESLAFTDSRDVSFWAQGMVKSAVDNYIVSGYPDNSFAPQDPISKAQMAVLVSQCIGSPVSESGDYELGGVFGNVTITAPNVTLRNTTISGDLYVSGGVGLGGIKLENVNVLGRIIISGTGESEAGDASVVMRNVTANEMLVDNMRNKTVTIRADGITDIAKTTVRTNAYLEDNNTDDKGLMSIELDGESGTRLTLAGRIKEVVDKTPNSYVQLGKGSVAKLTVDEAATNSTVQLDRNTEVKEMNLDVASNVTGDGDIEQLNVNAPGSVVAMLPDKIYIRPGLTSNIAGVIMDYQAAEEGSLDPRLLSGYPSAQDITPTGLRADFAGNKKGTIYWAVSSITDGSVGEDDLISPPSYGSIAVSNGSIAVAVGGEEVSAQITGLTVGGTYYLSAILVDDLGNRSPVKVISFATPDNSVPAFGQGYPYMSFIGKANEYETMITAQVAVMATKTCKMYYAVLPAGSAAPTVDELRSAAVSANLGYGVVDMVKNQVWDGDQAFIVSRRLEELKDYVLYLWLTDGVNSSAVTSLAFSTPDVTPPSFISHPQTNGDAQPTAVPMTAAINENGTIYWVAVESGASYPLPNAQNDLDNESDGKTALLTSEYAKLQVINGMNAVSRGQVNATANTPVNFNITGLEQEKSYDIYYLAVDTAGNRTVQVYKLQGGVRTQDNTAPTVRQFFTKVDPQDATRPMRDTAIVLEFSENVRLGGSTKDLLALYEATQTGTTSEKEAALEAFVTALRSNIEFYVMSNGTPISAVRGNPKVSESGWAIDFSLATVANVSGKVQITFPNEGLQLDSGASYYFEVNIDSQNKISDLSGHEMDPSPVKYDTPDTYGHSLPQFTVVFARVDITSNGFSLSDQEWPVAIQEENRENQDNHESIGAYQVDFKFRMMPDSTETVADGIAYDLLLWVGDTINIEYDLYYRAVTESGRVLTVETDDSGNFLYGMPNMPAVPDKNGWVKLGESDRHFYSANSEGKSGKRLHYTFNGCTSGGTALPALNQLVSEVDGEKVYYDFAVSVRKMDGDTNPNTWGKTVSFYVDVAAGYSNNLFDKLGDSFTPQDWRDFRSAGLNGGGGESIGSVSTAVDLYGEDTRQLRYDKPFKDSIQPAFTTNAPTFVPDQNDETKMNINLALTRPGTVYYVIALAHNDETSEPADTTNWVSSVITYTKDGQLIKPEMVPGSGAERENENPPLPELDERNPEKGQIQSPSGDWVQSNGVVASGSRYYPGTSYIDIPLENLKPNRTYYAYFTITGTGVVPSDVEIYKFKTNPPSRPVITPGYVDVSGNTLGRATITTDINSTMTYKVYTKSSIERISWITNKFTSILDSSYVGKLPPAYQNMDVYTALMTPYAFNDASEGLQVSEYGNYYFPTDASGSYNGVKRYSVFDIYASENAKDKLRTWLEVSEVSAGLAQGEILNRTDEGKDIETRAGVVYQGNAELLQEDTYYVISMARKSPEDANSAQNSVGTRFSFMGGEIKLGNQKPPELLDTISIRFDVIQDEDTAGIGRDGTLNGGQITLTFDKVLYKEAGAGNEIDKLEDFFAGATEGIENLAGGSSISNTGNRTSIILKLKTGVEFKVSGTVVSGTLKNIYGSQSYAQLDIEYSVKTEDTGDSYTDTYTITVSWKAENGSGLVSKTKTETVTKVRPKIVTDPARAYNANGTAVTYADTGNLKTGSLDISFDQALYTDEGTPLTSADLASILDEAEGIDLSRSTVVNNVEDNSAQIKLALEQGASTVSAKIDSGAITNSSGVATEEALIITGSEKKTTNGTTGMTITGYSVDIYWGDEKLKTITGTTSK